MATSNRNVTLFASSLKSAGFSTFVTIERFVSEIYDFRYQSIRFAPNLTNSVISVILLSFLTIEMTKCPISVVFTHFIHSTN